MTNPALTPVLIIRTEYPGYDSDYETLVGRVQFRDANAGTFDNDLESGYGEQLYELCFSAQADKRQRDRGFYSEAFAFQDISRVTLYNGERFVKVLRKLRDGQQKVNDSDGWHKSIGQYVLRACKILGIAAVGFHAPHGAATWSSGEKVRYYYKGEIAAHVDSFIFDWMAETGRFGARPERVPA